MNFKLNKNLRYLKEHIADIKETHVGAGLVSTQRNETRDKKFFETEGVKMFNNLKQKNKFNIKIMVSMLLMMLCLILAPNVLEATGILTDITPPTGTIEIVGNVIDGVSYVSEANVTLKLTASDNKTATKDLKMKIYNESDFLKIESLMNVVWDDFEEEVPWKLEEGDGYKVVYLILKDEEGNVSYNTSENLKAYTITFDTNGGNTISDIEAPAGVPISAPADPTREGYTFIGWDKEIPSTMPAEDLKIKANWKINKYTLTFDLDNGSEAKVITADYGTSIETPENPTKEGYNFVGWDKEIPATIPAENITIKAIWEAKEYEITFNTDGGSSISSEKFKYGETIVVNKTPTKEGYNFAGWQPSLPATMPAENLNVTATWTPRTDTEYAVFYFLENIGNTDYTYVTTDTKRGTTDATINISALAPATIENGTYSHASLTHLGEEAAEATIKGDGTTVIYLYYSRNIHELVVTGNENIASTTGSGTYKVGQKITITATLKNDEGYTYAFRQWTSSNPSLVPNSYTESVQVTIPDADITMTAEGLKDAKQYNVTLNKNDGSGVVLSIPVTYGGTYENLPELEREGYSFAGWWTEATGGRKIEKTDVVTTNAEGQELYARWTGSTNTKYTVYHYLENIEDTNYTLVGSADEKYGTTDATISIATLAKDVTNGTYDFGSLTEGGAAAQNVTIKADGTTKVYLYYSRNTATLTLTKGNYIASVSGAGTYKVGKKVTITATLAANEQGYTNSFAGWTSASEVTIENAATLSATVTMPASNVTLTANGTRTANTDTPYVVYHYLENANDTGYTLAKTENKAGTTGATLTLANLKTTITNGTYSKGSLTENGTATTTVAIAADGSTKVYLYYTRNKYTLTVAKGNYIDSTTGTNSYKVGATVNISATLGNVAGYNYVFAGWTSDKTITINDTSSLSTKVTMPAYAVTVTATGARSVITYDISYDLAGGTVSGNPTTYNVETASFTLANPTKAGYIFTGWTGSNGTTAQTTVKIPAGSTGNKVYKANWNTINYEITLNNVILPTGYTMLDYIQSTGTQWINSGVTIGANTWVNTDLMFDSAFDYNMMFGSWTDSFAVSLRATNVVCAAVGGTSSQNIGSTTTTGVKYNIILGPGKGYVQNGVRTALGGASNSYSGRTILLFGASAYAQDTPHAWNSYGVGKIYSFKIYNGVTGDVSNSTLLRDFVPCKNASGTVGLYDMVNGVFYGNAGSGTFTAGNTVSSRSDKITYNIESQAIIVPALNITGYTFTGWTGTGLTSAVQTIVIPTGSTGNRSYTANYSANAATYNIVYKSSSGKQLGTSTATYSIGTTNTISPQAFTGYTSPANQSVAWDSATAKTITFTYTPISYSISYTLNGGSVATANPTSYTIESAAIKLNNPTRTGYTFTGWSGSGTGTSVTIAAGSTGNKSYTANWSANTNTAYTVKHYLMNLDGSTYALDSTQTLYGTTGASVTPAAKSYTGFTAPSTQSVTIAANGGTVVEYKYTRNKYYLDLNGVLDGTSGGNISGYGTADIYVNGSKVATGVTDYYTQHYYGSTYEIKNIVATTGHTYNGVSSGSASGTIGASNLAVQLSFSTNSYTNSISHWTWGYQNQEGNNGGKNAFHLGNTTFTGTYGNAFTLNTSNATTIPNGFYLQNTFGTSSVTGSWQTYNMGASITQTASAMSFEYDYYPNTYTITYNLNGGTNNSSNPTSYNVLYGVTLQNPTRTGYTFTGWTDQNGNKVTGINAGANASFASASDLYTKLSSRTTGNKTLTANWTPNKIKLTLNPNGGTGGTQYVWYYYGTSKFYSNEACTTQITAITRPTRTGYTYVNYHGDGTSGGTNGERYIAYDSIEFASDLATDIYKDATLYAEWSINTYTNTVNHITYGTGLPETTFATTTFTAQYGSTITLNGSHKTTIPAGTTVTHYGTAAFAGSWISYYVANSNTVTQPAGGVTINLYYQYNTYTITTSAGANGTITPVNPTVTHGKNQTIKITPNEGYQVSDVLVDGVSVKSSLIKASGGDVNGDGTVSLVDASMVLDYSNGALTFTEEQLLIADFDANGIVNRTDAELILEYSVGNNTKFYDNRAYIFKNVTANHTISATFTTAVYTITFDANGGQISGTNSATTTRTATHGSTYGQSGNGLGMPTATRSGYALKGWYTAASGGTQVTSSTTVTARNHTLYAQWEVNTVECACPECDEMIEFSATGNCPTCETWAICMECGICDTHGNVCSECYLCEDCGCTHGASGGGTSGGGSSGRETCPECGHDIHNGYTCDGSIYAECRLCDGGGTVGTICTACGGDMEIDDYYDSCEYCMGDGIRTDGSTCRWCGGDGMLDESCRNCIDGYVYNTCSRCKGNGYYYSTCGCFYGLD